MGVLHSFLSVYLRLVDNLLWPEVLQPYPSRGIITSGPYRWLKHPAYLSKNLSWWLISVPFLAQASYAEAVRHSILLLLVNGIYLLRAITEERHLSWDEDYVAYKAFIRREGLWARMRHLFARRPAESGGS
jgi:protein-S-isoprenylcysteine O-methyltransferase Ste14